MTNSDGQSDSGTFDLTVIAAATEGYLYCPANADASLNELTLTQVITNQGATSTLGHETFNQTYTNADQPDSAYLYQAQLSGSQLQCIYQRSAGDTTYVYESDASQPLTNAQPAGDSDGSNWNGSGTVCNVNHLGDTGCRVKFDL